MSLRASVLAASLTVRACAPVLAASACLLVACQSDAERARELLEGPGAGTGVSARDALVQATTLDPTLREAWARLADVELAASRWVEADAAAQRAIALSDTSAHEHEVRSRALVALERWSDAEPEILREITLGAPEAPARTRLGKVQEHLDRPDDAVASYQRAIELEEGELDATAVEARCALARILLARLEPASEDDAWDGNEAGRTEIRSLIEGARAPASGTPFEEEVTSLSQSLTALDQRALQLAARRAADALAIFALVGPSDGAFGDAGLGGEESANLWGDQIGDAFGAGGLGLSGIGEGGGGGEGIGLGSLGTIGHGGGLGGGSGVGYGSGGLGSGAGRGAGRLEGPGATVSVSATANGALDAAAITAVARRQSLQLRHCYETALRSDPALAGTMRIEVSVTAAGAAEGARASGFGDATLTECMSRSIGRAAFPPSSGTTSASVSVTCSAAP